LGLNPTVFYGWQRQFFENGAAAFQRKRKDSSPSPEARRLEKLETKLTQKNEMLAELMQEHVQLKKGQLNGTGLISVPIRVGLDNGGLSRMALLTSLSQGKRKE